jgi:NhaA family Na+:H+ antiporter
LGKQRQTGRRASLKRLIEPIARFLRVEAAGGIVLGAATVTALALANSPLGPEYAGFWSTKVGFTFGSLDMVHSLKHWISDGLMTIFFFVVGLEIKREMVRGELREVRRAILPVFAAVGGMAVPAAIYLWLQAGEPGERGWGIPMATDIAFVVGCMALLGDRIPRILRVVLLSLAIVDDIGAILVIAVGYTEDLNPTALLLAFLSLGGVLALRRIGVRNLLVYVVAGILVWLALHESGVHATIAGVILGLMTPATGPGSPATDAPRPEGEDDSPLAYLENLLHPWSSFLVMPVFALANAAVRIDLTGLSDPVATAVMAGLVIGKPVGILLLSWLAVVFFLKRLPEGLTWTSIAGGGFFGGIGFTMALFIAGLALDEPMLDAAKLGIMGGSVIAAVLGAGIFVFTAGSPPPRPDAENR